MGVLFENRWRGGVSVGGWSPTMDASGATTGSFSVSTPSATGILKAFLIAGRCGVPTSPLTVVLFNGSTSNSLTFNNSTRVSAQFTTAYQNNSGLSSVHAIDVTSLISLTATNYTLTVPAQAVAVMRYTDFALAIAWHNPAYPFINTQWWVNDNNITAINNRTLPFVNAMDNTKSVAMSLMTGYICNINTSGSGWLDPSTVLVNATSLGLIGSTTGNGDCSGGGYLNPIGNFTYANNVFTAGANCSTDQAMSGMDVLSDIKVPVGAAATSYTFGLSNFFAGNVTNNLWMIFTTYYDALANFECEFCNQTLPTVSNITVGGGTINWCPQGGIVNWQNELQYRLFGTSGWLTQSVNNVSSFTFPPSTLVSNSPYEFRIVNIDTDGAICQPSAVQRFIPA